ncbi:GAF and ANTAR domain-containing protein [Streptomyces sp. Q6]|uniref:GAF and ANTAR domain-containing protein n=1 Tax=Streptomyces citrinus TaxID=3118173 RepID=A0ACD5AAU2_9ACTN
MQAEQSPDGGPEEARIRHLADALRAVTQQAVSAEEAPAALCRACTELLPVSGASVSLSTGGMTHALWYASDDIAARLAEAQYTLGDGPCRIASILAAPVLADDLAGGPDARRWPVFAHQAVDLGVRAVFSLPLGAGGLTIGTLDLYSRNAGPLSERDTHAALLLRDAITFAVLKLPTRNGIPWGEGDEGVASWVEAAEADHAEVHQAVGMVMIQLSGSAEQALDRLRARAFAQGRSVTEVARDVVARSLRFRPEDDQEQ